mmetsp:Transcript_39161/g.59757  ORF Transcript_39161/g.59757 Transcript_39161/m.59757 type:complete len:90 (-) Transcript_39161:750-1019(-)|eukprot:CAMPEP_0170508240 /NCGR_PEP_ID=MMETSP0208-20121228/61737_1 /TAXON_ID=197538 /ORGANISM="Strombidium inclinatum, Strain S3" /LENGTH=89 /DNA_ID=CAMNT_0010791021 /DNA_START=1649 /DNA_END=1918 /DNA_ORIENTATION=+
MRLTKDRLDDFRHTLMEIVDVKNGHAESDYIHNKSVIDRSCHESALHENSNMKKSPLKKNGGKFKSFAAAPRDFAKSMIQNNRQPERMS